MTIVVAVAAALLGFGLMAIFLRGGGDPTPRAGQEGAGPAAATSPEAQGGQSANTAARGTARQAEGEDNSFFSQILGGSEIPDQPAPGRHEDWLTTFATVTIRLTLAALLAAMLAFRPRRFALFFKRNPFVAQTQILLAVVASALMMIVGDSAARAFGIFAAVSLVRFRTNIRDPKEITVLLISLAIGLAAGVGRWELATILSFFALLLLWGLEYREPELVFRAMELCVKTRNVDTTQEVLLKIFRMHEFSAELRTINRPDEKDPLGCIIYYVNVSPLVSTDRLSLEILAADTENVDSVEWNQKKESSYFYQ